MENRAKEEPRTMDIFCFEACATKTQKALMISSEGYVTSKRLAPSPASKYNVDIITQADSEHVRARGPLFSVPTIVPALCLEREC